MINKFSMRTKILTFVVLLLLSMFGINLHTGYFVYQSSLAIEQALNQSQQRSDLSGKARIAIIEMDRSLQAVIAADEKAAIRGASIASIKGASLLEERILELAHYDPDNQDVAELQALLASIKPQQLKVVKAGARNLDEQALVLLDQMSDDLERVNALSSQLTEHASDQLQESVNSQSRSGRHLIETMALSVALVTMTALISAFWFTSLLTRPLDRTIQALRDMAQGDLSNRLPETGKDEFAAMANALNRTLEGISKALGSNQIDWDEVAQFFTVMRADLDRTLAMMHSTPTAIMMADVSGTISYMNPSSIRILSDIHNSLSVDVEDLVGQSVTHFDSSVGSLIEQNKGEQDTEIVIGEEHISINITPIHADDGTYLGPMLSWEVITERRQLEDTATAAQERERAQAKELETKVNALLNIVRGVAQGDLTKSVNITGEDAIGQLGAGLQQLIDSLRDTTRSIVQSAETLAGASEELSTTSGQLDTNAEKTSNQASAASQAADETSRNVESAAAAIEQMSATIRNIADNSTTAAEVGAEAVRIAEHANTTVNQLSESSASINGILKVINTIAEQTNLLALNATIEAARAGEAGKGFAVVASEVKELARETARATDEIGKRIGAIQTDGTNAVVAIEAIASIIERVSDIQGTIAAAVVEQTSAANEISQTTADAARGNGDIARNIGSVADIAQATLVGAASTRESAGKLAELACDLQQKVRHFRLA